ncbi:MULTISPECIES: helix-turn-helix transcriptional regulator [Enterobacteriaceae]|uniref:helix-turn-helix transcriptional regulator n=1 Tax=Enterobacteriaceae TaxID=543 RepID=UPI0015DC50D9|nr:MULTISPECIES: helix-turn-helix transcriptional regulator [unclassified Klebsiella]BBR57868.1 transcriptional regulator [Klebsiella sp. WP4-W18-ESBL-05]BBS92881.1 transcriptional regulator [Klebsiella sp. WP7-S18-CRE-02]BBS97910.1 transcriptional regulator [Klebsiella sp. WP7-S18-CRE-03]BBT02977.1 transcriptional regulator [Klebsiella sp. WP7-S18-ESBL-04]BBT72130.1 transcriptional regulator [Klebsiella sp. WP8-S18-ESBL-06]
MSLITPGEAAAPTARQDDSRKQLGAFLRARRESLDPQRLGLPRSGRRRTPGLRREEVAMLADVGVTWYTWLEQGREVNPSVAVMQAIAEALQCSELETRHLFVLAGLKPLESAYVPLCEGISPGARRMLDSLLPQPASIQRANFDIVAWNDAFCRLMGVDFSTIPEDDRNCIYLYLTHPGWRSRLANRDVLATFVSYFRAAMAEHRGDAAWENKLARFFAASSEFEALWHQRYDVRGVENQIKDFHHPEFGDFQLQQMYWYSAPRNGSRLLVYLPVDDIGEAVLAKL